MKGTLIWGKYLVVDPDKITASGAVYVEGNRIVQVGTYADLKKKYPQAQEIGSSGHMVLPAFVNAHGHGKGITDFQRGQIDDTLETWKFRGYPPIPVYEDTLWNSIKMLEAGVSTTMHNHMPSSGAEYLGEFNSIIDAYEEAGLKVAFAPNLAERNTFVYGDNEAFIESLPPDLAELCRGSLEKGKSYGLPQYMAAVDRLNKERSGKNVRIMHGPLSPQWIEEESLEEIRRHATAERLRIHTHVQQTQLQKLYGRKAYGKSLIGYMADKAFLGDDVTLGHAVWVSEEDIEMLADADVSVTHHATCNLRVRNGVAPVFEMLQRGVPVAVGMDDKEFGDDKDFIEEMRLISKLHRLPSHMLDSAHLLPEDVLRMGTLTGAKVLGFENELGSLEAGKRADMVLIDLTRVSEPFVHPSHNPIDLLLYRCGSRDVDIVLVDGRVVVEKGRVVQLDRERIAAKLAEAVSKSYAEDFEKMNTRWRRLRPYIAEWFQSWYGEMEDYGPRPFYHFNNRD
jgi:5-methylthioadenosine/S-adenosylhomocysteine deaminase